jgi:cell division protein FtsZ
VAIKGARGVLINITGGNDMTLYEVDEAANRIREEVDPEANIIFGSTFDEKLAGKMRISVVATGIDVETMVLPKPLDQMQKRAAPAMPAIAARSVSRPSPMPQMDETEIEKLPAPLPLAAAAPAPAPRIEAIEAQALGRGGFTGKRVVEPVNVRPAVDVRPAVAPNPFAEAAMENGGRAAAPVSAKAKSKGPSLFERVTNAGRLIHPQEETLPKVVPQAAPEPAPHGLKPVEAYSVRPEPQAAQPAPAAKPERPARPRDEDLLEIPAFLRRQAN